MSVGQRMADLVQEVLERHPSGREKTFQQAVPFSFSCSLYIHGGSRRWGRHKMHFSECRS